MVFEHIDHGSYNHLSNLLDLASTSKTINLLSPKGCDRQRESISLAGFGSENYILFHVQGKRPGYDTIRPSIDEDRGKLRGGHV
jgi:hypothetical protein